MDEKPRPQLKPSPKLAFKEKGEQAPPPVQRHKDEVNLSKKEKKKRKKKNEVTLSKEARPKGGSSFMQTFLSFLFGCAVMGLLIYHRTAELSFLAEDQISFARWILVIGVFAAIIVEAFIQDMLQGILSLFFPPYSVVYGLFFTDSPPLRGLSAALICFLSVEATMLPNDSVVISSYNAVNEWYQGTMNVLLDKEEAGFE